MTGCQRSIDFAGAASPLQRQNVVYSRSATGSANDEDKNIGLTTDDCRCEVEIRGRLYLTDSQIKAGEISFVGSSAVYLDLLPAAVSLGPSEREEGPAVRLHYSDWVREPWPDPNEQVLSILS